MQQAWVTQAVARHEGPLYAYVLRLTGDPERSRDIVQDAFVVLCRQHAEINAGPWLYSVCRNRAIDIARKERRMTALSTMEPPTRERGPAEAAEADDSAQALVAKLAGLSALQQEAVRLKFHQQFSYREIAEVMGVSVSHVGVLLHEALKALRVALS